MTYKVGDIDKHGDKVTKASVSTGYKYNAQGDRVKASPFKSEALRKKVEVRAKKK